MDILAERVKAGIDFLDEKGPKNWREKINCETLDLRSESNCILGQLFGSYSDAIHALNLLHTEERINLGFTANITRYNPIDLTNTWREYLCD